MPLPPALLRDSDPGPWLQTLELLAGRLHPLVVHFPIAFLLTAAALELAAALRRRPQRSPLGTLCLSLGLVSAAAAAGSGWLLAANEVGGGERLELHRWSGVGAVLVAATAWLVGLACRRSPERVLLRIYRLMVIAAALLVGLTSHVGADLVWGPGWLTAPLRSPSPPAPGAGPAVVVEGKPEPAAQGALAAAPVAIDFWRDVRPILEQSCFECHGATQAKGRLRLHERDFVLGAAARRAVVVPGEPQDSELLRRVGLPPGDEEAMPPEGERLSPQARETLRRWIAEGASWPPAAGDSPKPPQTAQVVPEAPSTPAESAPSTPDPAAALARLLELGARAQPLAQGHPGLEVDLRPLEPERLAPALAALAELGPALRQLRLSGVAVADGDLAGVETWVELESARLDETALGDATVAALARLPRLRTLNLVGTPVGDAGLAHLAQSPSLARVYVWRSAVTAEGARALETARPDLRVISGAEALADPAPRPPEPGTGEPAQPAPLEVAGPLPSGEDLARAATALLEANCVACHGPQRSRGRLRLDSREGAVGRRRPVIVPGDGEASELLRRVSLAPDDPDVMPPDPPQLGAAERQLLAAWIAAGAAWPAAPTPATPSEPPVEPAGRAALPAPDPVPLALLRARGALAQPIAQDETGVEVSFRVLGQGAGDGELALLRGLEPNLVWLDLAGSAVSDAGLGLLADFAELERLNLERTAIGPAGLVPLARLERLRVLNLFGTRVGDDAVETLASFPALERVHVWQSGLSAAGAAALRARRPGLEVLGAPEPPQPPEPPKPPGDGER